MLRISLLTVLIIAGLAAGTLLWTSHQRLDASRAGAQEAQARLDASVAEKASAAIESVSAKVLDRVRADDDLTAADRAFNQGRQSVADLFRSMAKERETLRSQAQADEHSAAMQQATIAGGIGVLWLVGLVVLAWPVRTAQTETLTLSDAPALPASNAPLDLSAIGAQTAPATAIPSKMPAVDLMQAAAVCGDMARLTDADGLAAVLSSVARVIDAWGIVVWLGAGDQLFPVTTHGYDARVVQSLKPMGRDADNVTVDAWRLGEFRTQPADPLSGAAIAAPLMGTDGCRGVLAIEVPAGRDADVATRAVTTMFAAQLAGIVGGWPAASVPAAGSAVDSNAERAS